MLTIKEVYITFRKEQSRFLSRPFKIPNDFDSYFRKKMTEKNRESLVLITTFFNTKWQNIEHERYFRYGFELFKGTFTYTKFFDERLHRYYKVKDKIMKRDIELSKKNFVKSAVFIKKWIIENIKDIPNTMKLRAYCFHDIDGLKAPVKHFITGKIDRYFLTWLMMIGLLQLTEHEKSLVPLVVDNYREYKEEISWIEPFLNELKEKIG